MTSFTRLHVRGRTIISTSTLRRGGPKIGRFCKKKTADKRGGFKILRTFVDIFNGRPALFCNQRPSISSGRGEHNLSGVRQEEDHGGDGGEERVVGGQKKKEKQEGQVRTTETTVKIGMRARRSLISRSPGCVHGSRRLGITFSSMLGGLVASVHGKPASMTKPSSCTYVLSSSCLCCKYMIVPIVCSFNSHPHPVTKRRII